MAGRRTRRAQVALVASLLAAAMLAACAEEEPGSAFATAANERCATVADRLAELRDEGVGTDRERAQLLGELRAELSGLARELERLGPSDPADRRFVEDFAGFVRTRFAPALARARSALSAGDRTAGAEAGERVLDLGDAADRIDKAARERGLPDCGSF